MLELRDAMRMTLIGVTCLLMLVAAPHALEDFHYGDLLRLGVPTQVGIAILVLVYALQVIGMLLVAHGSPRGALLLGLMGAIWCIGALLVHGHDMFSGDPLYRHGLRSRVLEALIVALGACAAVIGTRLSRAALPSLVK